MTGGEMSDAASPAQQPPGSTPGYSVNDAAAELAKHKRLLRSARHGQILKAFTLGFAPQRTRPVDARQGGDRSGTLTENYAPGITGLQSASSLGMRDTVSHVRTFFTQIE
jgi:hypothetical protein